MTKETFITAKEARAFTDKANNHTLMEELGIIQENITNASLRGESSIRFTNKTFLKATIEFLKLKGFQVEHFTGVQWDPANDTIISW